MKVMLQLYEGKPIGIKLPAQVTLEGRRGRSGDAAAARRRRPTKARSWRTA